MFFLCIYEDARLFLRFHIVTFSELGKIWVLKRIAPESVHIGQTAVDCVQFQNSSGVLLDYKISEQPRSQPILPSTGTKIS